MDASALARVDAAAQRIMAALVAAESYASAARGHAIERAACDDGRYLPAEGSSTAWIGMPSLDGRSTVSDMAEIALAEEAYHLAAVLEQARGRWLAEQAADAQAVDAGEGQA